MPRSCHALAFALALAGAGSSAVCAPGPAAPDNRATVQQPYWPKARTIPPPASKRPGLFVRTTRHRFAYLYSPAGRSTQSGIPWTSIRLADLAERSGAFFADDVARSDGAADIDNNDSDDSRDAIVAMAASPGNRRLVAVKTSWADDSSDNYVETFDLLSGNTLLGLDEGSFTAKGPFPLNQGNCRSPEFDAFVAGLSPSDRPLAQFQVWLEGGNDVLGRVSAAWVDDGALAMQWTLPILMTTGGKPHYADSTFAVQVQISNDGSGRMIACTGPARLGGPPGPVYSLGLGVVSAGRPPAVPFEGVTADGLPVGFGPGAQPHPAAAVAGNIPRP